MQLDDALKTKIKEMGDNAPNGFVLRNEGLFFMEPGKKANEPPVSVFVSDPIWVTALTVSERAQWGIVFEFIDHNARLRRYECPASRMQQTKKLVGDLMDAGLYVSTGKATFALMSYLSQLRPLAREREAPEKPEQEQIIEDVREFILRNSDKFQRDASLFQVRDRAGFYMDGQWRFTKTALGCASPGHSAIKVAKALLAAGFLHRSEFDRLTKKVVTNEGRERLYCVSGDVLTYDAIPNIVEHHAKSEPAFEATADAVVNDVFSEHELDFYHSVINQNEDVCEHEDQLEKLLDLRGLG